MAGSTISLAFKITGDANSFKDLIKDAEGLKKAMSAAVEESQQLNNSAINFAAVATGIDALSEGLSKLRDAMADLTAGYNYAVEAETKLTTVMRQRMNATQEEIDKIKELALAEREKGVIDDDVQLMGAQQIATFLTQAESINVLIPAMNNLLAQQKGYAATGQDAVTIGNLIGKVMMGQTSALTRVGITFSEAEVKVLKFGNESQRAAMLAQVITNNVGQMNQELGATDVGKQVQLEAKLGDIQDELGALLSGAMPFVNMATSAAQALASIVILTMGVSKAVTVSKGFNLVGKAQAGVNLLMASTAKTSAVAMQGGAVAATRFGIAVKSMMIATGVGIAIVALTTAIEAFSSSADNASKETTELNEATDELTKSHDELAQAVNQSRAALELDIQRLKEFSGTREQEIKLVKEMNNTYGETMGYFSSVADWYNALIANSENYCRQMVLEAKTRSMANKIAENEERLRAYRTGERNIVPDLKEWYKSRPIKGLLGESKMLNPAQLDRPTDYVIDQYKRGLAEETERMKSQMREAVAEVSQMSFSVKGSTTAPTFGKGGGGAGSGSKAKEPVLRENASTLSEITENIQYYQKQLNGATAETAIAINKEIAMWEAKANAIRNAGKETEKAKIISSETTKAYKFQANTLGDIENNIQILQETLLGSDVQEASAINKQIALWEAKADAIRNAGKAAEETGEKTSESLKKGWSGVKGFASGVDSLTSAIEGNGNAWNVLTGIVDGFISIYDGITEVVKIVQQLTGVTNALTTAKIAEATATETATAAEVAGDVATTATSSAKTVAKTAETNANVSAAVSGALSAHSGIPFVGIALGLAAVGAILAAMSGIPKFANGGIVSGPTLAMVGEYGGASNNPEVIAPLNKLRSMLAPQGMNIGEVEFVIKGRNLVGILQKENTLTRRS
jgi:hypothetical protein